MQDENCQHLDVARFEYRVTHPRMSAYPRCVRETSQDVRMKWHLSLSLMRGTPTLPTVSCGPVGWSQARRAKVALALDSVA